MRAWQFGALAALFETLSLAAVLPLFSLVIASPSIALGPLQMPRCAAMLAIIALYATGLLVRTAALHKVAQLTLSVGYALSAQFFERILHQPYAWHAQKHSADIRTLLVQDTQELMSLITIPAGRLVTQIVLVGSISLILLLVRPIETLIIAVLLLGAYAVAFAVAGRKLKSITQLQIELHRQRQRAVTAPFGQMRDVRLSQLEPQYARAFAQSSARIGESSSQRAVYMEMPKLLLEGVIFLVLVVFMVVLATDPASQGADALPTLALFAIAGLKLFPIGHLIYANLASLRGGLPLLASLSAFSAQLQEPLPEKTVPRLRLQLRAEEMSFAYPGRSKKTLSRITLDLKPGASVAIVGPSGTGKSTFIDLVAGLLQPSTGAIIVDGLALTEAHARSWQSQIAYCSQSPAIFDANVADNVTNGLARDEDALAQALYISCLENLKDDLGETTVGELGQRLSGGQIQRIGLARALYRKSPVLILDEPTANLDAETTRSVLDRLFASQGATIFIIVTHDERLAARCGQILELGR
jgi:ABC-type multidrug transport system fused ATPase/permease subunit